MDAASGTTAGTFRNALVIGALGVAFWGGLMGAAFRDARAASSPSDALTVSVVHQDAGQSDLPGCLLGDWRHAPEEDTPELRVYRPADYPFPPARGRTGFTFRAGGELISYGIAPADGVLESPGQWTFTPPNLVCIELDSGVAGPETLAVVSCSVDVLAIAAQ